MRRIIKILTGRLMIVVPLILLQLAAIVLFFYHFRTFDYAIPIMNTLALLLVLYEINLARESSYKIAWCILLLGFPFVGVPLYFLSANKKMPKKLRNGTIKAAKGMEDLLKKTNNEVKNKLTHTHISNVFRYGANAVGFPVYQNTKSTYFNSGEAWAKEYLKRLRKAKHFIFMEYFIIDSGSFWNEILDILKEKVKEGVEVYIIYDDFGSITLPWHYDKKLKKLGIHAYRFNPIRPAFIIQMNNRSHRKITVIDNRYAFTGGVNIADEYVAREERFGYWKDSAILLEGEAVWSMTVMFLGMLSYVKGEETIDYQKYHIQPPRVHADGVYQPYSDSPTDGEDVAFNIHMNMIKQAKNYIYINTPYLIPNETLKNTLILAAKSGVDVRILTPHIPDKKLVFQITRANYMELLKSGVRIFEYSPGFNHTKDIVVDDELAVVGSVNMDYRSYYLHFENGVLVYSDQAIRKIKGNFENSLEVSEEITIEKLEKTNVFVRLLQAVLNVFMPLV
ncbi:MAG: cardiolipin synthase [Solobacterium sp.]|nr:cardiolipin synthase [Solobacterium sp.]